MVHFCETRVKVNNSNQQLDIFGGFRSCEGKKQMFCSNKVLEECPKLKVEVDRRLNSAHFLWKKQSNFEQFPELLRVNLFQNLEENSITCMYMLCIT